MKLPWLSKRKNKEEQPEKKTTENVEKELAKREVDDKVMDWPERSPRECDVSDVQKGKSSDAVEELTGKARKWETEKDLPQGKAEQDELESLIETLAFYKEDPLALFQSKEWVIAKEKISATPPTVKEATIDNLCNRLGLKGDFKRAIRKELLPKEEPEEKLESWPEPVDGAELANMIKAEIRRYVILEDYQATAITLWVFLTYVFDAFPILPLLAIVSPTKRCGKTRLLEVIEAFVRKGRFVSNVTSATIYRLIEQEHPTFLMDEKDTYGSEELVGILNGGHTRRSANVPRTEWSRQGVIAGVKNFSTWSPKVYAMIENNKNKDTLIDRSVMIYLRRKLPDEKVARLRIDFFDQHQDTRQKLLRWAEDNFEALKMSEIEAPSFGNDRAADNWTPLYAISKTLGGDWLEEVERAYKSIETSKEEDEDIKIKLLTDIKTILEEDYPHEKTIPSSELVEKLVALEDKPWGEWKHGKPLTTNSFARLLRPFGIKSKKIRFSERTKQGYGIDQFESVFERYLPSIPSSKAEHTEQTNNINRLYRFQNGTEEENVPLEKPHNYLDLLECSTCSTLNNRNGEENENFDLYEGVI